MSNMPSKNAPKNDAVEFPDEYYGIICTRVKETRVRREPNTDEYTATGAKNIKAKIYSADFDSGSDLNNRAAAGPFWATLCDYKGGSYPEVDEGAGGNQWVAIWFEDNDHESDWYYVARGYVDRYPLSEPESQSKA